MHQDSAAHQDGRLRKGDLILAVNEVNLRSVFFYEAVKVLRESPSPLRLMILRENAQKLFTTHQSRYECFLRSMVKGNHKKEKTIKIHKKFNYTFNSLIKSFPTENHSFSENLLKNVFLIEIISILLLTLYFHGFIICLVINQSEKQHQACCYSWNVMLCYDIMFMFFFFAFKLKFLFVL